MSSMSWILCVAVCAVSFTDYCVPHSAMALFALGNVLLGIAVVLSVIISLLTGTISVQTCPTCIHFEFCAADRTSGMVLSSAALGASQLYSPLKVVVNRYKATIFTFATRVASRIACALGKLVLHILGALFRKAAAAVGCCVLRTVQFVAIWFAIAALEVVSYVVLGSGTLFLKGGKFAREYSVMALKMSWCMAIDICKIVKEEAHTAYFQSSQRSIIEENPLVKTLAMHFTSRQSVFYGPLPLASSVPVSVTSFGNYTSYTILSAYTYTYYALLPVISITQVIRAYDVLTFLVAGAVHSTELLKLTHVTLVSSTPETSFLTADSSFESATTLCEDSDASDSDSEQDDEQRTTDKLNPHAPAYTPSASLLAKALTSKFSAIRSVVKTSSKTLDPRKEAFVPSGLRIIAPVQTSSDIFAVSLTATALPWTPLETSTPKKPLDPRKEAFVPSGLRIIAPVQTSSILAVSLTAAALSWTPLETSPKKPLDPRKEAFVPARVAAALATTLIILASTASPKFAQASPPASSPETVSEEPTELVRKKHGKRVPTWLRRQRKRERVAAERATAR
ncbi:hypothetical protein K466DRAFT_565846 [Polyporus arcularius HHB13444]|uniref:Uncharacterized protein n=1 Tax=Polyporus arcularius HHB13444 TaxID=1314778 RepID=A0A5C3PAJ6_9APHY|nr:hypothetical protein K466DRAFT_565846 [Polyporus arcularius HHB13444]